MEEIELMTVIKEKVDRLTARLAENEQKITFLEMRLESQKRELEEMKADKSLVDADITGMKSKLK